VDFDIVLGVGGDDQRVIVEADDGATVADLAEAIATFAGEPGGGDLYLTGHRLSAEGSLDTIGLTHGSRVDIGAVSPFRRRDLPTTGRWELAVVGGSTGGGAVGLATEPSVVVGRSNSSDLCIPDRSVSRSHARLAALDDTFTITDLASRTGVGLRGHRATGPSPLQAEQVVTLGDSVVAVRRPDPAIDVLDSGPAAGTLRFNRPPRVVVSPPPAELAVPEAPPDPPKRRIPLLAALLPLALVGVLVLASRGRSLGPSVLFLAMSPVLLIGNLVGDRRSKRVEHRRLMTEYQAAVTTFGARRAEALDAEERHRRRSHPDPTLLVRAATTPTARLWERRATDDDFLVLRVGLADQPARLVIKSRAENPDARPVAHLVPVTIALRSVGVIGVAGPRPATVGLARWFVSQLTVWHAPSDVRLVVLAGPDTAAEWAWATWVPHLQAPHPEWGGERWVGFDGPSIAARLGELSALIEQRTADAHSYVGERAALPVVVVVIDGVRRLRSLPRLTAILRDGPAVGVVAVCIDRDEESLAAECGATVVVDHLRPVDAVTARPALAPLATRIDGLPVDLAERVARAVAPLLHVGEGGELPKSVRFTDLAKLGDPSARMIGDRWAGTPGGRSTMVLVGAGAEGPISVDLVRDGPHALIAGTTGAGKSELLQTLVASMAVANRPDALGFVLVDYKGGSALPHCLGMITDLDGHLAERALSSLRAELTRREALLASAGAKDLEQYWAMTDGRRGHETLGRLVVVIDEFATLVDDVPSFVNGVVGIGMRGRSLGVHVILATQRPGGVVSAELRANVNLRICLRVADPSESTDVIDSSDAARLTRATPGRAYIRTGHGELVAVQVARVAWPRAARSGARPPVQLWPVFTTSLGHRRPRVVEAHDDNGDSDLTALVAAICRAAVDSDMSRGRSLWKPPLPNVVMINDVHALCGEQ
jgi:S-DNA-T family DNA segregation ATPase FtsK/SpoIIIE